MAALDDARETSSTSDPLRSVALSQLIVDIASATGGERDLDQILHETLDRLGTVVRLTGGSIALVDGDDLVVRAAIGPFAAEVLGQRLRRGPGRSWKVVETPEAYLTGDVTASGLRIKGKRAGTEIRSWLAVPIVRRGAGIGLIEIDSTAANAFDEADKELLETIVRVLAGPIELASIHADEQRATALREAFVEVISHELRTPITTIYGLSKTLRQRGERIAPDVRVRAVEDIEAEADRLYRMVEDLLVLSRAERGRVDLVGEPINVGRVLRRTVDAEAARHPDRELILELPDRELPLVHGEESFVDQVVRNLVTNATKYSDDGRPVRIVAAADKAELTVRILDEGIGIDADDTDRAFELFYRAKSATRQAPGAGIGLFVCRQLVEAMGGRIWVAPRPEGGTEVAFCLPVRVEDEGVD